MNGRFYVTTPVCCINTALHIGYAYTAVLADVLARFHRSMGNEGAFLTGIDEHDKSVEDAAAKKSLSPRQYADEKAAQFQELWKKLGIANDDFFRTSEARHKDAVRKILQELYDKGEICKAEYTRRYCVDCERYFTGKELAEGKCPCCGREVSALKESNYFFKMSKYQDWLIDCIKTHPEFIQPAFRANEILGFLKQPLADLCISRPKSPLSRGIELPFDSGYVCNNLFAALICSISAAGCRWPVECQLIGKNMLLTHGVYWTAMLKAMGIELPGTIFVYGWWYRRRMSYLTESDAYAPEKMIEFMGTDALRYFFMAEMAPGKDGFISREVLLRRYNSDLVNGFGNLLFRVVTLIQRSGGVIPAPGEATGNEEAFNNIVSAAAAGMEKCLKKFAVNQGLRQIFTAVRAGNRYMEQCAPWKMIRNKDTAHLNTVLYTLAANMRCLAVMLAPVMPGKMAEVQKILGGGDEQLTIADLRAGTYADPAGRRVTEPQVLFPQSIWNR